MIVLFDLQSGEIIDLQQGSLTAQFSGDVVYAVTSAEPNTTGPFTVLVEESQPSDDDSSPFANTRSVEDYELPIPPSYIDLK